MIVETKYQNEIEINDNDVLCFDNGILGFEENKKYVILPLVEGTPVFTLQSIENPNLAFVVIEPFTFFKDYEFDLSESTISKLSIVSEQDVMVYVILTLEEPFEKTTANLQGPIIINKQNNKARQIVLSNPIYQTKHLLKMNPSLKEGD